MKDRRPPPGLEVVVDIQAAITTEVVDPERWAALARTALAATGVDHGRLDLSFVDAETMAELNRCHMHLDGPTDVLAFPIDAVDEFGVVSELRTAVPIGGRSVGSVNELEPNSQHGVADEILAAPTVLLGDIVICVDVATSNAAAADRKLDDEIALLVVHGVLHVMGLDHADPAERRAMQAMERRLLAAFHDPLASTAWPDVSAGGAP